MTIERYFTIDGEIVYFEEGQTILQAALAASVFTRIFASIPISARMPVASSAPSPWMAATPLRAPHRPCRGHEVS